MKRLLFALLTLIKSFSNAQTNPNIAGVYNLGSSSPEGGNHLIILENGKYAIAHFGGMQTGTWKFKDKTICAFTPTAKQEFQLYGRIDPTLKDSKKVFFGGFEDIETFINVTSKTSNLVMRRVFNENANCFDYPYVHTFTTSSSQLSVVSKEYEEEYGSVFSFDIPKGYNDFILSLNYQQLVGRPFQMRFENDKLNFDTDEYANKEPLNETSEDIIFVRNFLDNENTINQLYATPAYKFQEEILLQAHVYNKEKNAYINPIFYQEGIELMGTEMDFNNVSILFKYEEVPVTSIKKKSFSVDENSLFYVTCD